MYIQEVTSCEMGVCWVPGQDDHSAAATIALVLDEGAHIDQDQGDQEDKTSQSSERNRNSCKQFIPKKTGLLG